MQNSTASGFARCAMPRGYGALGGYGGAEAENLGAQEIMGESARPTESHNALQSKEPCPFQLLGFSPGGSMDLTDSWNTLATFLPLLKTNSGI